MTMPRWWLVAVAVSAWCAAAHAEVSIYVPDHMIQGVPYRGMVLLESPRDGPYTVLLASGGVARVPESVTVPAGYNHGIFGILPEGTGPGAVSALYPGGVSSTEYVVHPDPDTTRLRIVPPIRGDTLRAATPDIPIYVFHADQLGRPVAATHDIPIRMDSPAHMDIPDAIIRANATHAYVPGDIRGSGDIHASAPNMQGDSIRVWREDSGISVRVGVAPDPAPEGAAIPYFVWLERDGSLYRPARSLDVYVTSDNPLAADPAVGPGIVRHHRMGAQGVIQGTLYTGQAPGERDARDRAAGAVITASVPGVGSGSDEIRVGPHSTEPFPDMAGRVRECADQGILWSEGCAGILEVFWLLGGRVTASENPGEGQLKLDSAEDVRRVRAAMRAAAADATPDTAVLWAFPDAYSDAAWIVPGFYRTHPDMPGALIPADRPDMSQVIFSHASPPEVLPPGRDPPVFRMHPDGPVNVTVAGRGLDPAWVHIPGPREAGHQISVRAAPGSGGMLGMVSILDADGRLVHPGRDDMVDVSGYGGVVVDVVRWRGAAAAIYGSWDDSPGGMLARMEGAPPARVPMHGGDNASGILLWVPDVVHASEEFPYAVHIAGPDGSPVRRVYGAAVLSANVSAAPDGMMVAEGSGAISVVWGPHADSTTISSFLNPPGDIRVYPGESHVRLGDNVTIHVEPAISGSRVEFAAPVPFRPAGGTTYVGMPGDPGEYRAEVSVSYPGRETYRTSVPYSVDHRVDVSYAAESDDGIRVPFTMSLEPASDDGPAIRLAPGTAASVAPGAYVARFQVHPYVDGGAYELAGIRVDGEETGASSVMSVHIRGDSEVAVRYHRIVEVAVEGAAGPIPGSGAYRFGETVRLRAEPVPGWGGLVWDVPYGWDGLPRDATTTPDTAEFLALNAVDGTVVYQESHLPLVVVFAAGAAAPLVLLRDRLVYALDRRRR